jgi:Tol biopolymer transport system component
MAVATATLAMLAFTAPAANAAYPGENGRIAFAGTAISTVNPDGTGLQQLTHPPAGQFDTNPSWSPTGTRLAFVRASTCCTSGDVYVVNADGTDEQLLRTNARGPTWSPDETEIAFVNLSPCCALWRMNSDGTNPRFEVFTEGLNESGLEEPAWSPRGGKIAFEWQDERLECDDPSEPDTCSQVFYLRLGYRILGSPSDRFTYLPGLGRADSEWSPDGDELVYEAWPTRFSGPMDIRAMNADGTGQPRDIVVGPETDVSPAWSPDGSKIVFRREGNGTVAGLWVVGADGSGAMRIRESGTEPDWQPVHTPSTYVRPISAHLVSVPLVPAYRPCTSPNRQHGPPLAHGSCAPPTTASPTLTLSPGFDIGRSTGFMRLKSNNGVPGGEDDTDVRMRLRLTNVMRASDLSEYTGEIRASVRLRVTDKDRGDPTVSSTIQDFPLSLDVPCVPTPESEDKSICDLATNLDTLIPGSTPERTRAIWALDQLQAYDGGPDENVDTESDNSLFAVQGIFVP